MPKRKISPDAATPMEESSSLRKIREFLQDTLTSGAVVCLICIESVKRNDKIWSCQNCYCMLHLECIQKWAKDSLYYLSAHLDEDKKGKSLKWCCSGTRVRPPTCHFHRADWEKFTRLAVITGAMVQNRAVDDAVLNDTECIRNAADAAIPKTSNSTRKLCKP
ncbi:NF-X1-type zinc finger protein NFXL1 [Trichonephila clavipes]|nr:NF-X1-type zinc finger protein NFXL1 [Trichonephila clavipes]